MKPATALWLASTALCGSALAAQTPNSIEGLLKADGSIRVCGRTFARGNTAGLVAALRFCEGNMTAPRERLGDGEALLRFRRPGIVDMPEPGVGSPPPPPPSPTPHRLRQLERVLDANEIDLGVAASPQ
jgi:hypothetical protein